MRGAPCWHALGPFGAARALGARARASFARAPLVVLGVRLEGEEHLPARGGALVLANRPAPLVLAGAVLGAALRAAVPPGGGGQPLLGARAGGRRVRVLAPVQWAAWPLLAAVLPRLGFVPASQQTAARLLAEGATLLAFVESGAPPLPPEASEPAVAAVDAAAARGAPLVPCGVRVPSLAPAWLPPPWSELLSPLARALPLRWQVRLGPAFTPQRGNLPDSAMRRAAAMVSALAAHARP